MKRILSILLLVMPGLIFAATDKIHPQLMLKSIKSIEASEKHGDELYLAVTVYPQKARPKHFTVPQSPLYWPTRSLSQITNLAIWNRPMHNQEAVTIVLGLIERDAPPFNTDDLVGEVKIQLKNEKGQLYAIWMVPGQMHQMPRDAKWGKAEEFTLVDKHGKYQLSLSLEEKQAN